MTCQLFHHPALEEIVRLLSQRQTTYKALATRFNLDPETLERYWRHQRRQPLSDVPGFSAQFREMTPEERLRVLILSADQLHRNAVEDHDHLKASRALRHGNHLLDRLEKMQDPLRQQAEIYKEAQRKKLREYAERQEAHRYDWKKERDFVHAIKDKNPAFKEAIQRELDLMNTETRKAPKPVSPRR